jgi:hypothetical protein
MAVQRRYALLIGVDSYDDKHGIPSLRYCGLDCHLLQRALTRAGGFSPDNVLLMTDDAQRAECLPRRNSMIAQLRSLVQRAGEDDLVLIAFCGHARDVEGAVYLLPSDARASDLALTALPVEFLRTTLQACPARSKLVLLDACHSGSGRDMVVMTPAFAERLRGEGITILSACKVNEVAHESEELGQGVFSYFLARGLEGAAATPSGVVTADSLYHYVHREVIAWGAARGVSQTPWRLSEGVGDALLVGRMPLRARSGAGDEPLSMPRFHYGSVVPPDYYIDREMQLAEARDIIEAGQNFLLVGDRRAGKTSFCKKLIHQLMGRPENSVLASYLNLQRCHKLRIDTFLKETVSDMIGEIARQVFQCKFTDLMRRNSADAHPALRNDPLFQSFVNIFRLARKRTQSRGGVPGRTLDTQEFVYLVNELLEIIRSKGWSTFVIFYDEANRLPGSFPVEMLMSNVEALREAGIVSVYAASPDMAESFAPLQQELAYEEVCIGPFANFEDMQKLLARYYFGDALRTADLPLTPAALEALWRVTRGMPYLIQLVAGQAFRCALARGAKGIVDAHVTEACEHLKVRRPDLPFDAGAVG